MLSAQPLPVRLAPAGQARRSTLPVSTRCNVFGACKASTQGQETTSAGTTNSRREVLLASLVLPSIQYLASAGRAQASPLQDVVRGILRPELEPKQAVIDLLDARSTLREIEVLAANPEDSQARKDARKLWPGIAKRLRAVAEAGPVVASLITGGDKEATLSEMYGGTGTEGSAVTDALYMRLGFILTLSGRTIQYDAQRDPRLARDAGEALDALLAKVPKDLYEAAQDFRRERAAKAA